MSDLFPTIVLKIMPLLVSIILHEISHAVVANWLGDDTAKKAGRFKLHTHFDLFGSFIIPLGMYLMKSPFMVGYAKPVPIDTSKFKDPLTDMALVALAGPLCNLLLAAISGLILNDTIYNSVSNSNHGIMANLCAAFFVINLALFFFNLIPIPPLDGSRVLAAIMPKQWVNTFYRLEPFGFIIIVSIEMIGAQISKITGYEVSLFYYFVQVPIHGIFELLKT